jgi:hypothetical protein
MGEGGARPGASWGRERRHAGEKQRGACRGGRSGWARLEEARRVENIWEERAPEEDEGGQENPRGNGGAVKIWAARRLKNQATKGWQIFLFPRTERRLGRIGSAGGKIREDIFFLFFFLFYNPFSNVFLVY